MNNNGSIFQKNEAEKLPESKSKVGWNICEIKRDRKGRLGVATRGASREGFGEKIKKKRRAGGKKNMGEIRAEQRTGVCADPNQDECQASQFCSCPDSWQDSVWPKRRLSLCMGENCGGR